MSFTPLESPPSSISPSALSPGWRMLHNQFILPDFEDILHKSKTINQLINESTIIKKNSNSKLGASGTASIYEFPNGKKYIVRKTPSGFRTGSRLLNEIKIYRILLSSPNYKKYISNLVYADAHLASSNPFSFFVFEYEEGNVLDKYIIENKGKLSINDVMKIYENLQESVDFLALNNIVHKDLKPENIYITKDNDTLLFDFDTSCIGSECLSVSEFSGSPQYATPKSMTIRGQVGFTVTTKIYKYSPVYDKYSLAIILNNDLKN